MKRKDSLEAFIRLFDTEILNPAAVTPSLPYSPILTGDSGRAHFTSVRSTINPGYNRIAESGIHADSIIFR